MFKATERKYSSFCQFSKTCEKKWGSTHKKRQLVCWCFSQKCFICWWNRPTL